MSPPFLSVEGLELHYPKPWWHRHTATKNAALQNVAFELQPGERVGLVGVSGSGKSSLLRCLLGLETPDRGRITCNGQTVQRGSVVTLRWYRRAVQYVPQDHTGSLEPRMTVLQSVIEPLLRLGIDCDPTDRAREALEAVGLDKRFLGRKPGELSGGQAQRVAIARAIAPRPGFLLADEPVSGLDMTIRVQVIDVFRTLSEAYGTGVLMVSHDLSAVSSLCERTLVMSDGRIVEDRSTIEVLRSPQHKSTRELISAGPPMTLHTH